MSQRRTPRKLPSYRNPPLTEVACGLKFQPLEKLTIPHVGVFWESLRKDFPNVQHAAPLGVDEGTIDRTTNLPVPRIWLINKADDRLLQIQRNMFFYNWRRRQASKPYPRYPSIVKQFRRRFSSFIDFLGENDLGSISPIECELAYINHIPRGEGWDSIDGISRILPDFNWQRKESRFLPHPSGISWNWIFDLPSEMGELSVKLQQGIRKIDNTPILTLELRASVNLSEETDYSLWEWFPVAHEWIVQGFADLTGRRVQEGVWKRDDNFVR